MFYRKRKLTNVIKTKKEATEVCSRRTKKNHKPAWKQTSKNKIKLKTQKEEVRGKKIYNSGKNRPNWKTI